jgi:hypothetical protein
MIIDPHVCKHGKSVHEESVLHCFSQSDFVHSTDVTVGIPVGIMVGIIVGIMVGIVVGVIVGIMVGIVVGVVVTNWWTSKRYSIAVHPLELQSCVYQNLRIGQL